MHSRYARFFQALIIFGDLLLLNACFLLAGALRFDEISLRGTDYYDYYVQLAVFFNLSWLVLTFVFKTYDTKRTLEPRKATGKVLNAYFFHLFILLLFLVSLKKEEYSRLFLVYFYLAYFITVMPWRFYFLRFLRAFRRRGVNFKHAVLIGEEQVLADFYKVMNEHPEYGLKISACFSDEEIEGLPLTGNEAAVPNYIRYNAVDEIFCAYPPGDERYLKWFRFSDEHMLRFRVVPDLGLHHASLMQIDFYHDVPVLIPRKEPLEYMHNQVLKRGFDLCFSLLMIFVVFPWLFPVLALGVKLSGKGPIFFKQTRTGLRDEVFTMYKFRSMVPNQEADEEQAVRGDVRITKFGAFMRKHNLDEMPQFVNVLKGEMSVVGPRPHMLAHTDLYRKLIDKYMLRHLVKPGITGLAQIRGLRGETTSAEEMDERVRSDVYYIENWSLLLEFKILAVTIYKTLIGKK